jgi:uncharacterized protein YybS (DUF2232 family)
MMDKKTIPMSWIEIIRLVLISCFLLYLGYSFEFLNMVAIIVPVPLIIIGYKHGYGYLAGAVGVVTIFSSLVLQDMMASSFVLIVVGVNTAALCFFMKEQDYTYEILFLGTIICTASIIFFGPIIKIIFNQDLFEMIKNNILMTIEDNPNSQFLSGEPMTEEQISLMLGMIPFMIVYLSAIFVSVNYYLSRRLLVSQGYTPYHIQPIEEFRLPDNILAGTTVVLLLVLVTSYLKVVNTDILSQNAIYIFVCVFMFQGLAVIGHILVKRQIKNPVKTAILVGVFLIFGPLLLGLIGWLDTIVDFRKMKQRGKE